MSVVIKGMKMPKSCLDCDLTTSICGSLYCIVGKQSDWQLIDLEEIIYSESRHPKCPLVPLPEKHGRLIDVDALNQKIIEVVNSGKSDEKFTARDVIQLIENAPVIIEAEVNK